MNVEHPYEDMKLACGRTLGFAPGDGGDLYIDREAPGTEDGWESVAYLTRSEVEELRDRLTTILNNTGVPAPATTKGN